MILCAKFGWNWLSGSWKDDFKFCQCMYVFISLGKGRDPSFEQFWFPLTQNALCQVWLELGQCSQTDRWTTGNQKSSPVLQLRWAKIDYGNTWSLHVCFTLVRILVFSLSIWLNILSILCCQLSNRKSCHHNQMLSVTCISLLNRSFFISSELSLSSFFIKVAVMFFYV